MVSRSFLSLPLILHELYKKEVIVTSITLIPSNSRLLSHSLPWLNDPEFLLAVQEFVCFAHSYPGWYHQRITAHAEPFWTQLKHQCASTATVFSWTEEN